MAFEVNINGEGTVDKVVDGNTATLTAIPDNYWTFKYYTVRYTQDNIETADLEEFTKLFPNTILGFKNGETIVVETVYENPYTLSNIEGKTVISTFYVTLEDYLRGLVDFDVSEQALNSIRMYRGIKKGADVSELSQRTRDLAYADLLMWASTSPSSYTGGKDSDGGWSHTESSKTITVSDKKRFESMAKAIYKLYQDRRYTSSIRIVSLC